MQTIEWLNHLCISEVNAVNLYDIDAANYPMRNRGRYHHGLMYALEGTETFTFEDRKIAAVPDSVLYLPKNEKYTFDLTGKRGIGITIDFELAFPAPMHPFCVKFENTNTLKADFAEAEKVWRRKRPGYEALCKSLLYKAVSLMIQQEDSYLPSRSYTKIAEAVEYLHKHYTDHDFKIETLFLMSGTSPKYFETLFFERFHMTPKEYVISLKMERAKELLLGETISVGDIAELLGYHDLYHFSKIFKTKTGYSPSEFRRSRP